MAWYHISCNNQVWIVGRRVSFDKWHVIDFWDSLPHVGVHVGSSNSVIMGEVKWKIDNVLHFTLRLCVYFLWSSVYSDLHYFTQFHNKYLVVRNANWNSIRMVTISYKFINRAYHLLSCFLWVKVGSIEALRDVKFVLLLDFSQFYFFRNFLQFTDQCLVGHQLFLF